MKGKAGVGLIGGLVTSPLVIGNGGSRYPIIDRSSNQKPSHLDPTRIHQPPMSFIPLGHRYHLWKYSLNIVRQWAASAGREGGSYKKEVTLPAVAQFREATAVDETPSND